MITQFLADLDFNCETKKKDWAAYKKMEVTEDLFIVFTARVSKEVCQANSEKRIAFPMFYIFDSTFLAFNCYDFELGEFNFNSIVEFHFQIVFNVWPIGSSLCCCYPFVYSNVSGDFALSMISSKALRESGQAKRAWHKHDLEGRVGMSREREEPSLYIGSRGGATEFFFCFAAAFSCSVARLIVVFAKYS